VTFDNGPVNLLDPGTIDQLGALIGRPETDLGTAIGALQERAVTARR
jgi:hypothetical protein